MATVAASPGIAAPSSYRGARITAVVAVAGVVAVAASSSLWDLYRSWPVRQATSSIVGHLEQARQLTVSTDADHRLRVLDPQRYVIEKRMGAGWIAQSTHEVDSVEIMMDGSGAEFHARGIYVPEVEITVHAPGRALGKVHVESRHAVVRSEVENVR